MLLETISVPISGGGIASCFLPPFSVAYKLTDQKSKDGAPRVRVDAVIKTPADETCMAAVYRGTKGELEAEGRGPWRLTSLAFNGAGSPGDPSSSGVWVGYLTHEKDGIVRLTTADGDPVKDAYRPFSDRASGMAPGPADLARMLQRMEASSAQDATPGEE